MAADFLARVTWLRWLELSAPAALPSPVAEDIRPWDSTEGLSYRQRT
jgi:hypothetical protein